MRETIKEFYNLFGETNTIFGRKFFVKIEHIELIHIKNELLSAEKNAKISVSFPYNVDGLKLYSEFSLPVPLRLKFSFYSVNLKVYEEDVAFNGESGVKVFMLGSNADRVEITFSHKVEDVLFKKFYFRPHIQNGSRLKSVNSLIKLSKNKNNVNKFFHHLKSGNFKFIKNKIAQKLKEEKSKSDFVPVSQIKGVQETGIFDELFCRNNKNGNFFKPYRDFKYPNPRVKAVAFYLPQFHPIRENDEWWGKGFTEWTNVSKAVPQFSGHYQPHLPGELGFYDLRLKDVMKRQIELAKNYGIYGFCFHFYWFNGRRVLEKPLDMFFQNKDLDIKFCVNWANENWTRRWDGDEADILLQQKYSDDDDIRFIDNVSKIFKDDRYIRIDNKPVLMIYRPSLFPDIKKTAKMWRQRCLENGTGEIYLLLSHAFEHINPESIGFDGAVEFPPNTFPVTPVNEKVSFYNKNYNGLIFEYDEAVEISKKFQKTDYKKFRGVFPGWDNEARKPGRGTSFINSTPDKYENWLRYIADYTLRNFEEKERFVFINAFNEWAEGCHLEPDRLYGHAYLEATKNGLCAQQKAGNKIIYVTHDAYFHGAQLLSLNIVRELKNRFKFDVFVIMKEGGPLEDEFNTLTKSCNLQGYSSEDKKTLFKSLKNEGFRTAIVNTVVSGDVLKMLVDEGINCISLIHELPDLIRRYKMEDSAKIISMYAEKVVFASPFVRDKFVPVGGLDLSKAVVLPQGLYQKNPWKSDISKARGKVRRLLNIPESSKIVICVGYGDNRKGVDLFVEAGKNVTAVLPDVYFVWVGNLDIAIEKEVKKSAKDCANIIFVPNQKDPTIYYAGADIYLLTSREDPFPSVVLEAMNVGVPVIGFDGAGGFTDIVTDETGRLAPYLDVERMCDEILKLLNDNELLKELGENARKLAEEKFEFKDYVYGLLSLLGYDFKKISVVVPNYNYERYIDGRINSITEQNYPVYELIFLDDNSTDKSVELATEILSKSGVDYQIFKNSENSGSVFKQWAKGVSVSKGDYVWVAEADDYCEDSFLGEVTEGFGRDETVITYCQSKQMDENGKIMVDNYLEYTNDVNAEKWLTEYFADGAEELKDAMSIKNSIPNVSAVVFKKFDLNEILDELLKFKVAGDWYFYVWLLKKGGIYFSPKSLNYHRRHSSSVTHSLNAKRHFDEVCRMQDYVRDIAGTTEIIDGKIEKYRQYLKRYLKIEM